MITIITRRDFLRGTGTAAVAASLAVGCGGGAAQRPGPSGPDAGPGADAGRDASSPPDLLDASADAAPDAAACLSTEDNPQGPFHRDGAPYRTRLARADKQGTPLVIRGVIYGPDCVTPLRGAIVDVWHADNDGHYDNDDPMNPPAAGTFLLRGQMLTDDLGRYEFETIVPGRYLNGNRYRPSHIHYTVTRPGYEPLTTQLYFAGDPFIEGDTMVRESLIITLDDTDLPGGTGKSGVFDIVLSAST